METLLVLELSEKLPNACREFAGVTAWELPGFSTKLGTRGDGKEIWAAGWTECDNRRVSFHAGDGFMFKDDQTRLRNAWNTAYIHEFIHIAQRCFSPNPIDPGQDDAHSNWTRDGLEQDVYDVINKMESK